MKTCSFAKNFAEPVKQSAKLLSRTVCMGCVILLTLSSFSYCNCGIFVRNKGHLDKITFLQICIDHLLMSRLPILILSIVSQNWNCMGCVILSTLSSFSYCNFGIFVRNKGHLDKIICLQICIDHLLMSRLPILILSIVSQNWN